MNKRVYILITCIVLSHNREQNKWQVHPVQLLTDTTIHWRHAMSLPTAVATALVVLITHAPIVWCNGTNTWNKPPRWLVRWWKHHKKIILGKYVSPPRMQGDVWWVTWQWAITFEPRGIMGIPAYGQIFHDTENLFSLHLSKKHKFKDSQTKSLSKIC